MNSIIFIGDSKDNFFFKYDVIENKYITLNYDLVTNNIKDSDFNISMNLRI